MGGFGSGFQGTAKATTRERHALRVKDWGNLPPGARADWTITRGGWQDLGAVHVRVEADALALTYTLSFPRFFVFQGQGFMRPVFLPPAC